jgi:peptidoglycan/LPS O-acetylase OafA/YrhL
MPTVALSYWTNSIILEFLFGALLALGCRAQLRLSAGAALSLIVAGTAFAVALGPFWGMDQLLPRFISGAFPPP